MKMLQKLAKVSISFVCKSFQKFSKLQILQTLQVFAAFILIILHVQSPLGLLQRSCLKIFFRQ